jgi:hypothetical protein
LHRVHEVSRESLVILVTHDLEFAKAAAEAEIILQTPKSESSCD